MAFAIVIW